MKALPRFQTWPGDLTRLDVFEDCCRAIDADQAQKAKMTALVADALEKIGRLPDSATQDDVRSVHAQLRARIAKIFWWRQRARFEAFCAERDRR